MKAEELIRYFKSLGLILSKFDKEKLKAKGETILFRRYIVSIEDRWTFIAPYETNVVMDKGFKEECRRLKIAPKLRGYLYGNPEAMSVMRRLKGVPVPLRSD